MIFEKQFKIPYEKVLNTSQLKAVKYLGGNLLVIAGAGSGKTRTLIYRVAYLIEEGISPGSILLLTFTRKAAKEMLRRASELLDGRCDMVSGGTFHSFANSVLRKYASKIGFHNDFTILDRSDSEDLISILRKEMGFSSKLKSFPRKQTLMNIFTRAINKVQMVEDVIYNEYSHFEENLDDIVTLFNAYQQRKREHYFFDYDDLLYVRIL